MSKILDMQKQTGFIKNSTRSPEDYYITPDIAIKELLKREKFEGLGWEPACGNGAIVKFFPNIMASDIRTDDEIVGEKGIDFLKTFRKVDFIITNPPFKLAEKFIKHALECKPNKLAIFGRIQLLEGQSRYKMFKENPPDRVYVFSNRISTSRNGTIKGGLMCFCWFVWDFKIGPKPIIKWILCEDYGKKCR